MPNPSDISFIDLIQEHERAWGKQTYPGRPSLAELLSTPVLLIWQSVTANEKREMFSVHSDLSEVHKYATRIVLQSRQELPARRLIAIYLNQKKASIRGVTVDVRTSE